MPWQWPVGALCAFLLALITTPAGVSGAVLLLPIQLSVLHVRSPAVTPTNLVFNIAATPGGLIRFWREHRETSGLLGLLVAGTLPGVIAGAVIRVELLSGSQAFLLVASGVLLPLGLWLLLLARCRRVRRQLSRRAAAESDPRGVDPQAARGDRVPGRGPLRPGGRPACAGAASHRGRH
jgi:uncharacterized protein